MKLIFRLFCLLLVFQLCACASQSDPAATDAPFKKKKQDLSSKQENATKSKGLIGEKNNSMDDKGGVDELKGRSLPEEVMEEEEMGLSIISYQNIEEKITEERPVQGQKVKLSIQNNHKQAMWYLMPVSGEKEMPKDGRFRVNPEANPPFLAKGYGQMNQTLIELIYHGQLNQSFRAFCIEAGSSLLFRNYDLGTYSEGEYVPFWAVKELVTNNQIKLENWLPFSVTSSPNVVMHNKTESGTAKWVNLSEGAAFPSQPIEFIQAQGIKKYQIPVGVIR
ncbi:hypothetical protein [Aureispira anguillae]|uniref:Lipoprotein n=1 Tax=Aureispira anguillae TaxID=2864201 RepID=A0A915YBU8_9BACT|nr:hypothetical protein [Aureispira anguillae]BDS10214.1 hypothetical protein AsAng_0009220 [Aureispira anguillae]